MGIHPLDQRNSYKIRTSTKRGRNVRTIQHIKTRAKHVGLDFDLDPNKMIWPDKCPLLGIDLDYFANKLQDNSVTIDRTDPKKGYTLDNCVVMSHKANRLKSDGTIEEFEAVIKYLKALPIN